MGENMLKEQYGLDVWRMEKAQEGTGLAVEGSC